MLPSQNSIVYAGILSLLFKTVLLIKTTIHGTRIIGETSLVSLNIAHRTGNGL